MDNFSNSLNKSLLITLKKDYDNLFHSIVFKFQHLNNDLTLENLKQKYSIDKIYSLNDTKPETKKLGPHKIAELDNRCQARIWNNGSVSFKNGKIIYGCRCKRTKLENMDFCGIHSKSLTHGKYYLDPPHKHFEKFIKN